MRKFIAALKPYLMGSLGILAFTSFCIIISLLVRNNGITYFICGTTGAFGMGYYLHKFAKPLSPLTALLIIPCMFSGIFLADYLFISTAKIIRNIKPSQISAHQSSSLFELSDFHILYTMKSSYTGTWRYKDKSAKIHVFTVPVADSDWQSDDIISVFAICEKNFENSSNCDQAFLPHKRFAKRVDSSNSERTKSFLMSAKLGSQSKNLHIGENIVFIELIANIDLYALKKRRYGVILLLGLLFLWNFVCYLSQRYAAKAQRKHHHS